jgi:hypothetical protein
MRVNAQMNTRSSHHLQLILVCLVLCANLHLVRAGWIDVDTPSKVLKTTAREDGYPYHLVFSDEFNVKGRNFYDGSDPRWTAVDKDDYTNFALQYYSEKLASTNNGYLNISTIVEEVEFEVNDAEKGKHKEKKTYQSAMLQGWNKFCFTGGILEIRAKLPGYADVGGLWPAIWLLGNLARATYVGSSNNVWPWSFDKCDRSKQSQQEFSACNTVAHYDFHAGRGRGAPEIDILEAMPGRSKLANTPIDRPYFSTSLQVAPGSPEATRPTVGQAPRFPPAPLDDSKAPRGGDTDDDDRYGANNPAARLSDDAITTVPMSFDPPSSSSSSKQDPFLEYNNWYVFCFLFSRSSSWWSLPLSYPSIAACLHSLT